MGNIFNVEQTQANYNRLKRAFLEFGMPVFDMTEENFLSHPSWDVFTFGVPPVAIDIMVKVKGLDFADNYKKSVVFEDDDLIIRVLHKDQLIAAKKSSNRPKDQDDIANLS